MHHHLFSHERCRWRCCCCRCRCCCCCCCPNSIIFLIFRHDRILCFIYSPHGHDNSMMACYSHGNIQWYTLPSPATAGKASIRPNSTNRDSQIVVKQSHNVLCYALCPVLTLEQMHPIHDSQRCFPKATALCYTMFQASSPLSHI